MEQIKPGYKTSEFWLGILTNLAMVGVPVIMDRLSAPTAGFPPLVALGIDLGKVLLAGVLAKFAKDTATKFIDSRTQLKATAIQTPTFKEAAQALVAK